MSDAPKVIWVSFDPVFGERAVLNEEHTEKPDKWSLKYRLDEEQPNPSVLKVNVWVVLAEGHRPYVTTTEPSPAYYQSIKAQGARLYRAEIAIPEKIDDGKALSSSGERVL